MNIIQLSTNLECLDSFPGSPHPTDIFEPHMPSVDLLSDMDTFFTLARTRSVWPDPSLMNQYKGQGYICIVTPSRDFLIIPGLGPGGLFAEGTKVREGLLPSDRSLNITVITYNSLEAIMYNVADAYTDAEPMMRNINKCIPFFGFLLEFSCLGHIVTVFEGHASAFESGVRNSDVLLVDSGMSPFLQADWVNIAFKVMHPKGRILFHDREGYTLGEVFRRNESTSTREYNKPWWRLW